MGYSLQLYTVCAFAAIGGFCFGYDSGVISGVLTMPPFIEAMTGGEKYLKAIQTSVITGLLLAGCFVGSLFAGQLCEIISRKYTIILASAVFCIGAAVQTAAQNYDMMIAGRFVAGLGVGSLSMAVPVYLSELAPKEIRGRLISLQQLMITIGLMVAFWVGAGTQYIETKAAYRIPLGIQIAPAFILGVGSIFLPFSPRWLVNKGRNDEALGVLARLHSKGDKTAPHVVAEYEEIVAQVEHERTVSVSSYFELLKGTVRRRLILGVLIQVFQQFTGINSIMYYAPVIFQQAGIPGRSASLIASGVNGVLNVLATIPPILYLDRLGRRVVLISGACIMGAAMLLCGIVMGATGRVFRNEASGQMEVDMSGNSHASYFCIVMVYVFVAGFAYSWGPVGWVYPAEIYPLSIRAKGTSITTASNWLMNFIISLFVPVMLTTITWGTYIFFGCCCVVMAICVWLFYPETKGHSLEEMDLVFSGSILAYKSMKRNKNVVVTKEQTDNESEFVDEKEQA
ncbi:general substrate transporter [Cokeromyces recurvatus]|uniref:general substrate transporter n=1 Tax=Cokeromyces recurvatus TaxID=90255 RepID=UPI00221F00EB|nr:general substrate transporter [Cokeromyces recurvatus]KAI7907120.1 general substrate transporter [Cokeromyces recurvatus]